ncbi:MAG TPA: helix-turn-helix domain-containing protein [Solirubrobacteraceae bacterium]|nr:helix-turn-helix domain-containing protein [Solirubrobacteraceae bacterium]
MQGAVQPIARNLRRWRVTRGMTLSALAEQAGVAKSTVSLIERGQGNPSIDTVWALAVALGVPFASLFHDEPTTDDVTVVRADDAVIAVDPAGLETSGLVSRHLLTRAGGALIEIYTLVLEKGAVRQAQAHTSGMFEHLTVATGTVEISTDSFSEVLGQSDLISFRADRPHSYRVIEGPVLLVAVHEYPKHGQ